MHCEQTCFQSEYTGVESASDAVKIEGAIASSTWDYNLCLCTSR